MTSQIALPLIPAGAGEPPRQLRAFEKLRLAPGAARTVRVALAARDLSVGDTGAHAWKAVAGAFRVEVGHSSCDIRLMGEVEN